MEVVDALRRGLDLLIVQQDYGWFLLAGAWAWLGAEEILAWRQGRPRRWWVVGVAAAQGALGLAALARLAVPPAALAEPARLWEFVAWAAVAAQAGALGQAGARRRVEAIVAWGVVVALAIVQAVQPIRLGQPTAVEAGLALVLVHAGVAWRARREVGAGVALALTLAAVAQPDGAVALRLDQAVRWTPLSLLAWPALGAGLVAAWRYAVGPVRAEGATGDGADGRHRRRLVRRVAVWLAAGALLTAGSGWLARQRLEESLVARAQAYALMLDTGLIARWLEERFEPGETVRGRNYAARTIEVRRAPAINDAEIEASRAFLGRVEQQDPEIDVAHVATIRDGELLAAVVPRDAHGRGNVVVRHRTATVRDRAAWAERNAFFQGPERRPWGSLVGAWVPVVGPGGEMLGWLVLDVAVTRWMAVQAQARMQVLALVALGLGFLVLAERHRARAERVARAERAAEVAAAADRTKSAFLAQVSHELRTPIQGILGYGELLRSACSAEPQRQWVEAQLAHGQLLLRLVNDLLDAMSMERGTFAVRPQPGDLRATVVETVDSLRLRARERGLALHLSVPPRDAMGWLEFDAERVRQVVQNLVGNAIKFALPGRLEVALEILWRADGCRCRLQVRDEGPGIPAERQAVLFDPFVRFDGGEAASAGAEGVGLGLAICRGLCRAMGGDLTLESAPGAGSTFSAEWCFAPAAAPVDGGEARRVRRLPGRRVVVADDNALVREFLMAALRLRGAEVVGAVDGIDAIEQVERSEAEALVLDLSMPRLEGEATARRLRERCWRGRIVGVSAHANRADHARALAAGMDAFLAKPVKIDDVVEALGGRTDEAWEARVGRGDGDLERVRARLRQRFVEGCGATIAAIEARFEDRAGEALQRELHRLQGAAQMLGFEDVAEHTQRLQAVVESGDPGAVPPVWRRLRETLNTMARAGSNEMALR